MIVLTGPSLSVVICQNYCSIPVFDFVCFSQNSNSILKVSNLSYDYFFQQSICRFPEELRSTHFIAIRITDPDIIRTAKSIQENIVSKEEALNDCCMGIGKKHALKMYDQFVLDIICF